MVDDLHTQQLGIGLVIAKAARMGWICRDQPAEDNGVDAHLELRTEGKATGRLIAVQVKTGPSYFTEQTESHVIFRCNIEKRDYWVKHTLPVIIALVPIDDGPILWKLASSDAFESTGKDFKALIPKTQPFDNTAKTALEAAATPLLPDESFSRMELEDKSTGLEKRYSLSIILQGTPTRANVAAAARAAIRAAKTESYQRPGAEAMSHLEADAIFAYVYLTPESHRNHIHICRCEWRREGMPTFTAGKSDTQENIGEGVLAFWNDSEPDMADFNQQHTLSKDLFVKTIEPLTEQALTLESSLQEARGSGQDPGAVERVRSWVSLNEGAARKLYTSVNLVAYPPAEGDAWLSSLDLLVAHLDNVSVAASKPGTELRPWLFALDIAVAGAREQAAAIRVDRRRFIR